MTTEEIRRLQPGDIVTVVDEDLESDDGFYNWASEMFDYFGENLTVSSVQDGYIKVEEDYGEWCWYPEMLIGVYAPEFNNDIEPIEFLIGDFIRK